MSEQPRVVRLEEILDERQLKDVESIIHQIRTGTTKLDSLRFYLRTQEASLSEKEILPDYLFWSIIYAAGLVQ